MEHEYYCRGTEKCKCPALKELMQEGDLEGLADVLDNRCTIGGNSHCPYYVQLKKTCKE